jgi:lysozyme family protein
MPTSPRQRCLRRTGDPGRDRYKAVEKRTSVPWFFIGLCHMREGNFNFGTYLGNGQSISRPTTIVPIGRGPFASFEDGAVDALKQQGCSESPDWSLERIAFCLEGFNGFGYRSKGVNTPYLWAGTNRYTSGKYVADHVFDPAAVDKQLGSMAVLSKLCALDAEVAARVNGTPLKQPPPPDVPAPIKPPAKPKSKPRTRGLSGRCHRCWRRRGGGLRSRSRAQAGPVHIVSRDRCCCRDRAGDRRRGAVAED